MKKSHTKRMAGGEKMGFWDIFGGIAAVGDIGLGIANYNLQKETNRQNYEMWQEQMAREDTAVQRRMADLQAAGLSRTLAAGNAAQSSAPIRMEAPQLKLNPALAIMEAKKTELSMKAALAFSSASALA